VLRRRESDYTLDSVPIEVDWVAGMFVAFKRAAFEAVDGFDERYFMYMEDVDICRRLNEAGWLTVVQPQVSVVHAAQRASRKNVQHLRWHVASAIRYFFGPRRTSLRR
jgi:GT2 family glycosyltransferase